MTVDYHQFINRNLPLVERGCTSKAMFVSRSELGRWCATAATPTDRLSRITAATATAGTWAIGADANTAIQTGCLPIGLAGRTGP
jgi:hypothetical protein